MLLGDGLGLGIELVSIRLVYDHGRDHVEVGRAVLGHVDVLVARFVDVDVSHGYFFKDAILVPISRLIEL